MVDSSDSSDSSDSFDSWMNPLLCALLPGNHSQFYIMGCLGPTDIHDVSVMVNSLKWLQLMWFLWNSVILVIAYSYPYPYPNPYPLILIPNPNPIPILIPFPTLIPIISSDRMDSLSIVLLYLMQIGGQKCFWTLKHLSDGSLLIALCLKMFTHTHKHTYIMLLFWKKKYSHVV